MSNSIQFRILSALRARGLTGTDEELMSMTFFDVASAIALQEFDAGAEKFTGEIMDRVKGKIAAPKIPMSDGPCEHELPDRTCAREPSTHRHIVHAGCPGESVLHECKYLLMCAEHACPRCVPIVYPDVSKERT